MNQNIILYNQTLQDLVTSRNEMQEQINESINVIKKYQKIIESKISQLFQNRPVHLYGNLNNY